MDGQLRIGWTIGPGWTPETLERAIGAFVKQCAADNVPVTSAWIETVPDEDVTDP